MPSNPPPSAGPHLATVAVHAGQERDPATNARAVPTYHLFHHTLPRLGLTVRFVDGDDYEGMRRAINARTRAVYAETIGNPKLDVLDVERLARIAHEAGVPLVVDNTMASPALCRPLD